MTGLAADVNRRNFSAACPGQPQVKTIYNLEFAICKLTRTQNNPCRKKGILYFDISVFSLK